MSKEKRAIRAIGYRLSHFASYLRNVVVIESITREDFDDLVKRVEKYSREILKEKKLDSNLNLEEVYYLRDTLEKIPDKYE